MRIKLVIKRFHPTALFGGTEAAARRLAGSLAARGVDVDVLSARYRPAWKKEESVPLGEERSRPPEVRVRRLPHPSIRFVGTAAYALSLFATLIRERRRYDAVVTAFAATDTLVAALAGVVTGRPVVCKIASSGPGGDMGRIRRRWFGRAVAGLLRRVNRYVALNGEVEADLARLGVPGERVVRIPNGVDLGAYHPPADAERDRRRRALGLSPGCRLILGVGRLIRDKQWNVLIEALGGLDPTNGDWRGVVLGEGDERTRLEDSIRESRLEGRVAVRSEREDVRKYLYAADVFVLPSRREGLSNALLEAMAAGLPCLVSDIPGNTGAITNGVDGLVVPPHDAGALRKALATLLAEPDVRRRLGAAARRTAEERYGVERVAGAYHDLLRTLVGANGMVRGERSDATGPAAAREEDPAWY